MGWIQVLYKTYEKSKAYVGQEDQKGCILLPIAHSTQNAQIEVVLGLDGEFKGARKVEKAEAVTIIPVTEDSGSRGNGNFPHPLCDKLCYVAGDYEAYCPKKKAAEFFQEYLRKLDQWVSSGCHEYVKAVHSYVIKRRLVGDLIQAGILVLNEEGIIDKGIKIEGVAQTDALVRFRIQDEAVSGLGEIWKEQAVYDDYIAYYLSQFKGGNLDYITGEYIPCSEKHPSKIRNSGDKSKLISANDSSGFTYRGRFVSKDEAVGVGYLPSQKAHNVLRWLIERQGYHRYGMCVVTFNPEDEEIPDWLEESLFDTAYDEELESPFETEPSLELGETYTRHVNLALRGKYKNLDQPTKEIVVMGLDAATPGRLSITYFQQMSGSDFLNHLIYWYSSCCWFLSYKKKKQFFNPPQTPEPEDLVKAMYGAEKGGFLKVDDRLMEEGIKRLIPCMLEGRRIPLDMVHSAFLNACRPLAFNSYNRRKILEIACSLIRKKYQDRSENKKGEFDDMSLNRENHHRDYLYGRLLAVAHKLEYDTFDENERGKRETNAERYRSMMVKNPTKIWPVIEGKLGPYWKKSNVNFQIHYEKVFQEIYDSFEGEDFSKKGSLGERFLMGYHCQLSELWKGKTAQTEGKEEKEAQEQEEEK